MPGKFTKQNKDNQHITKIDFITNDQSHSSQIRMDYFFE